MAGEDIVRRVIIQTQIDPVNQNGSRPVGSGSSAGGGSRAVGGGPGGETPEQRTARLHGRAQDLLLAKAQREQLANIKAIATQTQAQRRLEEQQHKATMRMLREKFDAEVKGHRAMAQRLRSQMGGSGGGGGAFRSGPGVNRGGEGANYFSTGVPLLDKANQLGFQAFITTMTIRMIGQALKGSMEGLAGLSGEGEGIIAQATRWNRGDARSRRDPIRQWGQDTVGGIMRGFGAGDFAESRGFGRRPETMIERGSSLRSEIMSMAENRMTSSMRKEDELIQKKRELLRKEEEVLNKRLESARAETKGAQSRLQNAKSTFGRMSKGEQERAKDIFRRFEKGGMPEDFSNSERELIASNPMFSGIAEFFDSVSAGRGGFGEVAGMKRQGTRFQAGIQDARRGELEAQREVTAVMNNEVFKVELNIEKLEMEVGKIADKVGDQLVPLFNKVQGQLVQEIVDQFVEILEEQNREKRMANEGVATPFWHTFLTGE